MKKSLCAPLVIAALALLLIPGFLASAHAVPIGSSYLGREYVVAARDLTPWSAGIYTISSERSVDIDNIDRTMQTSKYMLYVGYDIARCVTLYVAGGKNETEIDNESNNEEPEFAVGARFNLLDHDFLDPPLQDDEIRINAEVQYSISEAQWLNDEETYMELHVALMFSLVNFLEGNKYYVPDSITLFVGPVYSDLEGEMDEDEVWGYTAGVEIRCTDRTLLYGAMENYDDDSDATVIGMYVRF